MTAPKSTPPLNPDCRAGKHEACTGDAWDRVRDAPTACACACHGAASS